MVLSQVEVTDVWTLQARKRDKTKDILLLGRPSGKKPFCPQRSNLRNGTQSHFRVRTESGGWEMEGEKAREPHAPERGDWDLCRTFSLRVTKLM